MIITNNFIDKIINKIGLKCERNEKKEYGLIIGRSRFFNTLYLIFCGLSLNKQKKTNIFYLKDKNLISSEKYFFDRCKIKEKNYKNQFLNILIILESLLNFFRALFLILFEGKSNFVQKFRLKDIYLGDLIFDSYVRRDHRFIKPKLDKNFITILFRGIFKTLYFNYYFNKTELKYLIVASHTYANNTGIAVRIALKKKIKVILSNQQELIKFSHEKIDKGKYYIDKKKIKQIKKIRLNNKNFFSFLQKRKKTNTNYHFTGARDIFYAYGNKKKLSMNDFYKKMNIKNIERYNKIIVIAPHAFSDASRSTGRIFLFTDYYEQLVKTLDFVKKQNRNILWVVRPHPSGKKYGEVGIVENLIKKINATNIKLCPKFINTDNLVDLTDGVITGRGKIALEYSVMGKFAILAGKCSYSDCGFLYVANSKKRYFEYLRKVQSFKILSKEKIILARKTLFYLENYSKTISEDELVPNFKDLKTNIILKKLDKNLKKKKMFIRSRYFLDMSDKLKKI